MFRFTIRDLLWLMVVVALGIMWDAEYRQRMSNSSELRADYERLRQERDRLRSTNEANRHIVKKAIDDYKAQKASSAEH